MRLGKRCAACIRLQGVVGQAAEIGPEQLRIDRKSAAAFAATERVPDRKAGAVGRVRARRRRISPIISSCVAFRAFERLRMHDADGDASSAE